MDKKKEERVPIPLRLPAELYQNVSDIVHLKKVKIEDIVLISLLLKL